VPGAVAESIKERRNPASFDDHYSQARLFFRSLSAVEQDHVIQAYTFELGKCFETAVRERQLQALANIDAALCAAVAAGLGMPAPEATEQVPDRDPSPAVSQVGETWPVAGRVVGIIVDPSSELEQVEAARKALDGEGMVPLVIAPTGGTLSSDGLSVTVQRTFLTARSTEFDALIVAGGRQPAPDATAGRDAKAGEPVAAPDPRVALMLSEAYRHAKAIGVWGTGSDVLEAIGIRQETVGIAAGDNAAEVISEVAGLLAAHRAWDRFPATGAAGSAAQ